MNRAASPAVTVMSSALYLILLFSALWTLSFCGTRQFHVVNEKKNWNNAQKYCREKFTDLATIESQEEMDALKAVLNGTAGDFWIGLKQKDKHDTTNWIWSDGSNSSYKYWNDKEPNNGGGEMCVQVLHDFAYRWNDAGCQWSHPFICYKKLPLILINQKKTWREALRYCRENHVDLVSAYTEEIQHWVETAVYYASTANVWMGLRHTCTLSFWFWVNGVSICYQNWAPGNGTGVEDCSGGERTGAVQSGSKKWVSLPENQRLNFICNTSEEI
ncbi:C-type mannose receptor 2-like [Colossoma macropomum]|uniref:C-type mannose receptor 2-like n=1 Tax=Colossoma macropomum TaxID=42526 RepID=UPI0018644768|nr:C-type mannose receptor 2-like [Colossoma macropomum]